MLRPLHDQKSRRDGQLSPELVRALTWWLEILDSGLCERHEWSTQRQAPVHLFCDARGYPAHLGAVLIIDGKCLFTHMATSEMTMGSFRRRKDNQIMALELLSISLGMCTFADHFRGRDIVVHSHNTGSEARWSSCSMSIINCNVPCMLSCV